MIVHEPDSVYKAMEFCGLMSWRTWIVGKAAAYDRWMPVIRFSRQTWDLGTRGGITGCMGLAALARENLRRLG